MLKVLELFSGTGCQVQALKNIGIECVSTQCEIDKYAVNTYNQLHGETPNLGDISKVKVEDLKEGQFDLITYSSPCFVGDSLVLTTKGYKQIKDVKVGDKVITHNGIYRKVLKVFDNGEQDILKIKGMGFDEIKCTLNHKFYVREIKYKYVDKGKKTKEGWKKKSKEKYFDKPKWIEAKDLQKGCYLGVPLNKNEIIPQWEGINYKWSDGRKARHKNEIAKYMSNNDFWWIVGRYIGDGWVKGNSGIIICTGHKELDEVINVLDKLKIHYNIVKERTTYKIQMLSKEFSLFFEQFGKGALNKHLTQMIFDLPREILKSMIEGYLSADGCNIKGIRKITTISRELAYGIAYCIMKAYHKPISLYKYKRENKYQIEKRIVNQHDTYQIRFNDYESSFNKAFYENGYIWLPFNKKEYYGKDNVYDIEIEEDHSFTTQNIIVHNCQDFSVAGLGRGGDKGSGTRSSLLFECEKIIRKVRPKYLLFENVKNLLSEKHVHNFMEWLKILEEMGYCSYYDVLNAKDFGIPQNRERIFCVSILGKHVPYVFPQKQPLKLRLKDMLEDRPDEKYYLSNDKIDKISRWPSYQKPLERVLGKNSIAPTLTARGAGEEHSGMIIYCDEIENTTNFQDEMRDIKEPLICASRGRNPENPSDRTVGSPTEQRIEINKQGIANTLTTVQKDNLVIEPKNPLKGKTEYGWHFEQQVYDANGIARTIKAGGGSGNIPKVMEEPKIERIGGMYGQATRWGLYSDEGISPTITASMGLGGGHVPMVEEKQERLSKQAYETLEENKCKDGDVINPFNKKVVDDGICPTITTRPEGFKTANLIVVDESIEPNLKKKIEKEKENIANSNKDIYNIKSNSGFNDNAIGLKISPTIRAARPSTIGYEIKGDSNYAKNERIHTLLSILWEEIRKKEIQGEIRRLFCFQEKEILQSGMHEKGIFENRGYSYKKQYILQTYSSISRFFNIETKILSNLWKKLKFRCASQGSQSTKQYIREFGGIMQELSYEDTQTKEKMYNLWQTNGKFELLRKTLSEIQKIWKPIDDQQRTWTHNFRIRKLTPRECWRLQGWKDQQFDKIKGISNAQLYKMAGNGIVIDVLEAIFTNMFLRKPSKEEEKFVVDKPLVQLDLF